MQSCEEGLREEASHEKLWFCTLPELGCGQSTLGPGLGLETCIPTAALLLQNRQLQSAVEPFPLWALWRKQSGLQCGQFLASSRRPGFRDRLELL